MWWHVVTGGKKLKMRVSAATEAQALKLARTQLAQTGSGTVLSTVGVIPVGTSQRKIRSRPNRLRHGRPRPRPLRFPFEPLPDREMPFTRCQGGLPAHGTPCMVKFRSGVLTWGQWDEKAHAWVGQNGTRLPSVEKWIALDLPIPIVKLKHFVRKTNT